MKVIPVPCGPFANESERKAVGDLKSRLISHAGREEWFLLSNVACSVNNLGQSDEIDLVSVSTRGVLVVEIKHWDAAYIGDHPDIVTAEAEKLTAKVKRLASKLRRKFPDLGFIQGSFLLTNQSKIEKSKTLPPAARGVKFHTMMEWKELLQVEAHQSLPSEELRSICHEVEPLTKVAIGEDLKRFGAFLDLEKISSKDDRFHRVYRARHAVRQDRAILHIYDLSAFEGKNPLDSARREYDTMQKLQKSPNIPRILDSFQDAPGYPGEISFFSMVDPSMPALRERSGDTSWLLHERRRCAVNCLRALEKLHFSDGSAAHFVHRNINPDTVLVAPQDEPLFAGLHLAKIPAPISVAGSPEGENLAPEFCAPEVIRSGLAAADQRSDIYALSATLKILFPRDLGKDTDKEISVLEGGTAEAPSARSSLADLAEELNLVDAPSVLTSGRQGSVWSEGMEVDFQGKPYRIVSRLGSGGVGTTYKVIEIDPKTKEEYGTYIAKIILDRQVGENALRAYLGCRKTRSDDLYSSGLFFPGFGPALGCSGFLGPGSETLLVKSKIFLCLVQG